MKRLFILLIAPLLLFSCQKEAGYEIDGKVDGLKDSYVYLKKVENNDWVKVDSVKAEAGKFSFEGKLESPEMFTLTFDDKKSVNLFLENSDISVNGHIDSLDNLVIKGSAIQNEYENFNKKVAEYDNEIQRLYSEYQEQRKAGNKKRMKEVEDEYTAVNDNRMEFVKQYVRDHTGSVVSPYVTTRQLLPYMKYEELDSLYMNFDPAVKKSKYAERLKERRNVLKRVQVGKDYIDFTLPDTSGNEITFSDYIGDGYVLLDFWASWCNPCRKENPNLVKNYKKYNDQGFEIFGVSLDRNKEAWIKAIKNDNLKWPHASDLKGWNNPTREKYGVMAIPANFLINKEGKIVAKDLRGEELEEKLKEIYEDE